MIAAVPIRWVVGRAHIAVASLLLLSASCTVEPDARDAYVSFADHVRPENVSAHPDLAPGAVSQTASGSEPSAAGPVSGEGAFFDDGSYEVQSPLVARKLVWRRQVWGGLSAPPGSSYRFPVRIRPGSVLEFGHTCIPGVHRPRGERVRLRGSVTLVTLTSRSTLFSVTWGCRRANGRGVRFEKIRLPTGAPGRASLVFATEFAGASGSRAAGDSPIWIAPHLYSEVAAPRNVIIVSMDTVRRDFLDVYGSRPSLTPHLARLAEEAVVFENAFSQSTWTLPSHVSLFSGLNPAVHQMANLDSRLPRDVPFLPVLLKKQGYATFAFTGDGAISHDRGFSRGFDLYKEDDGVGSNPDSAGQVFERAREFITGNRRKKFFLFLHTMQFHDPLESPPEILREFFPGRPALAKKLVLARIAAGRNKYRPLPAAIAEDVREHYRAEMKTIDQRLIGPLLRTLEQEGLYDETLLIVTSDHGEGLFEHGSWQHGHSVYNEVVRVPLLLKLPGRAFAGRRVAENVRLIDVLPTIMDSIGQAAPHGIDGESLFPLLQGKVETERLCVSDYLPIAGKPWFPRKTAITFGRHKLIANAPLGEWRRWYLDHPPPSTPEFELYDLQEDPREQRNVFSRDKGVARALLAMLLAYRKGERSPNPGGELDGDTKEQLRVLGYLE